MVKKVCKSLIREKYWFVMFAKGVQQVALFDGKKQIIALWLGILGIDKTDLSACEYALHYSPVFSIGWFFSKQNIVSFSAFILLATSSTSVYSS